MKCKVGSEEEQEYLGQLIQKYKKKINNEQFLNLINVDIKEYKYLQYLVYKYCFIPNVVL